MVKCALRCSSCVLRSVWLFGHKTLGWESAAVELQCHPSKKCVQVAEGLDLISLYF